MPFLIIDIDGFTLRSDEKKMLRNPALAGVILFARNYQNKTQLQKLTAEIHRENPDIIIGVDHEGGRVWRFGADFQRPPPMRRFGEIFAQDKNRALALAHAFGFVVAFELLEVGVDLSFAPVVDLDYGNSVIGDRAFSNDAETVVALAEKWMDGMCATGMKTVLKHFPGHGFVRADSHFELPADPRNFAEMAADLSVFKTLAKKSAALMPAHVVYPKSDERPAGFSDFWLRKILRETFKFKGAVVSDDLSMRGAADFLPDVRERVRATISAGCDFVMICNDKNAVRSALLENHPNGRRPDCLKARPRLDKIRYQDALEKIRRWL